MTKKFASEYNKYAVRALNEGYPRCVVCGEPIQKNMQKKGNVCRLCVEEGWTAKPGGTDLSGGPEAAARS